MTPEPTPHVQSNAEPVKHRRRRHGFPKKLSRTAILFLWITGALLTIGAVGAMTYYSSRPKVSPTVRAIAVTQMAIRSRLGSGRVISFSPPEWTRVEAESMNRYTVSGWGQVASADGSNVSFNYTSNVTINGNQSTVNSLDLLPQ